MIGNQQMRTRQRSEVYTGLADIVSTEPILLPDTLTTLYEEDNGSFFEVRSVHCCETSANADTVTVYFVEPGGTAAAKNMRASARTITSGGVLDLFDLEGLVINPGGKIQAKAGTAARVSIMVTGVRHYSGYSG